MRNSSIYRSNLSNEKVAFLSEIKKQNEFSIDDNAPKTYKRQMKQQKEIDLLWQNFKINPKEEKSPGIYLLTGFIAGALCMFIMNAVLSIGSSVSSARNTKSLDQPKYEKKISRKSKLPQINVNAGKTEDGTSNIALLAASSQSAEENTIPKTETYIVKKGDTMGGIVTRFYGRFDSAKIEKIKKANNLQNAAKLSIGQQLIIPLD